MILLEWSFQYTHNHRTLCTYRDSRFQITCASLNLEQIPTKPTKITKKITMNLKQRPEYIVSLFAAVAVNLAAYWWYQRTQKQLENGNGKDDDNEKPKQASKTPKKIGQTWNARKGVTVTPRVNMATVKKPRSAYTHRKYTIHV